MHEDVHGEVGDRTGLRGLQRAGVAEHVDVRVREAAHGVLVAGHEVQLVAKAGPGDVVGAHVQRHGDQKVETDPPAVEGDQFRRVVVDVLDGEVGFQRDLAVDEGRGEFARGHRLGERAVERGDVGDFRALPDAVLPQPVVGEEGELHRRNRALDRHLGDVHDQASAPEAAHRLGQRLGAGQAVELVHLLAPELALHAGGGVRAGGDAGGDHEHVVGQQASVRQVHGAGCRVDPVDLGEYQFDAVVDEAVPGAHDVGGVVDAERHEQVARLVVVCVVAVHDRDVQFVRAEGSAQLVGDHGSGGAAAEDDQSFHR